jgi:hypothetical protein
MKDKGHFIISLIKSILRIMAYTACAVIVTSLLIPMIILIAAEVGGILEEVFDKR